MTGWIAAAVLATAAAAATLWLWRSRPWRGPRTRYPVVLVHGILGFDEIGIGTLKQNYFRGIAEHLEGLGIRVYRPHLPPLGSVAERARALADALEEIPEKRINLVAHSMGGLDARYAISRLGCRKRVASLTTIGTPHRGTPVADLGSALLGEKYGLGALLAKAGLDMEAIHDLTTARMAAFNREVADVRGVRYASVVAAADQDVHDLHPLLKPSRAYLNRRSGTNDGLVPAASQAWGTVLDEIDADHWAQIGWSAGFDAPSFYESLMHRLRRRGL